MFVAVYEERSFTAAAMREFATQSGVSQHIKQMEEALGVQLFDRQKAVEPTAAGTLFYQHCREVLAANDDALRSLGRFESGLAGEVRFGLTPTLASHQLAPAYLRLITQHPNASVAVIDAPSDMLIDMVRARELDFAVIPATSQAPADLVATAFASTPAFLVGSAAAQPASPAHGSAVSLGDLAGMKLLAPDSREHTQWIGADPDLASMAGPSYQLDAVLATLDMIRQSEWRAILPGLLFVHELGAPAGEQDFRLNHFSGKGLTLELWLVRPSQPTLPPLTQAAVHALQQVIQEHNLLLRTFMATPA